MRIGKMKESTLDYFLSSETIYNLKILDNATSDHHPIYDEIIVKGKSIINK